MQIMRRQGREITVELVDDLDGTVASETVSFELDGECYVIDLSTKNAMDLRRSLTPFVDRAEIAYLEEQLVQKFTP